jgi:hypothetical protein
MKNSFRGGGKIPPYLKYFALAAVLLIVLKPLREALTRVFSFVGLASSQDNKDVETAISDRNALSPWSPLFYKQYGGTILTSAAASDLSKRIYDAFGGFNDDEDAVYAVFYQLKTKAQVSHLVDVFRQKYAADLLTFLRGGNWPQDRMSDAELNNILNYVNKLK